MKQRRKRLGDCVDDAAVAERDDDDAGLDRAAAADGDRILERITPTKDQQVVVSTFDFPCRRFRLLSLIIKRFVFRIDETVETLHPARLLKSDYVAGNHWEWFDELAEPHLEVLQKIATGNQVLMR